jgi:hypothetical protein
MFMSLLFYLLNIITVAAPQFCILVLILSKPFSTRLPFRPRASCLSCQVAVCIFHMNYCQLHVYSTKSSARKVYPAHGFLSRCILHMVSCQVSVSSKWSPYRLVYPPPGLLLGRCILHMVSCQVSESSTWSSAR